ncbi:MAG: hypothetical protein JRG96_19360 [Deltaproteobacteria bacterium]|nr:hypothetical protein [Deltaproteobacteria bacterium]
MTTRDEHLDMTRDIVKKPQRRSSAASLLLACAVLLLPSLASAVPPTPGECPVDFDRDGIVDGSDMNAIAGSWYAQPGDPNWDARLDLNGDLIIAAADRGIVASFWGSTDCAITDLPPATLWTGSSQYHAQFCPGGELSLRVVDQAGGGEVYAIPMEPEECLRSPVVGLAMYSCEIDGRVGNTRFLELIADEFVNSEGNHVCNPTDAVN